MGGASEDGGRRYRPQRAGRAALDPATIAAPREYKRVQDEERAFFGRDYPNIDRVFTWEDGRDVHPDVIRQRFDRLAARCGLPHIRLHDVRHSYATAALGSGVPLKIVSARLGHASPEFTALVYQHVLPAMDQDAANSIAALMVGPDVALMPSRTGLVRALVSKSVSNGIQNAFGALDSEGALPGSGGRI